MCDRILGKKIIGCVDCGASVGDGIFANKKAMIIPKKYEAKVKAIAMRAFVEAQLRFGNESHVIDKRDQDTHFKDFWKEGRKDWFDKGKPKMK